MFLLLIRDQEVDGSNPFAPTILFNGLSDWHLGLLGMAQVR